MAGRAPARRVVADLARRTGRFNLLQGAMNTCVAIGGSLSNLLGGLVADAYGYRVAFLVLAALALLALAFFLVAMSETGVRTVAGRGGARPDRPVDERTPRATVAVI
jgi:MFS family permease